MGTGYDDIDNLTNQTNQLYDEQMKQQQNIINTSTQQAIDELERNKKKAEEEALKTNRALYTDYQKQINPYGVNAENLAEQGLGGSGLAETTKANYYNTYQNARAEATTNANNIKADFDAQIARARQNGDLQMAQAALQMYQQKISDLYNTYNLKFNQDQFAYQKEQNALAQSNWEKEYERALQQQQWERQFNENQFNYGKERDTIADNQWQQQFDYNKAINDRNYNYQVGRDTIADNQWQQQFDYGKSRDTIADSQWQQQFDYNKSINDRNYNYQVSRDAVADSQWQKEYELSKKAKSSSGGSVRKSAAKDTGSGDDNIINPENGSPTNSDNKEDTTEDITIDDIMKNIKYVQGPNIDENKQVYDKYSEKYFRTPQDVIDYWTKQN